MSLINEEAYKIAKAKNNSIWSSAHDFLEIYEQAKLDLAKPTIKENLTVEQAKQPCAQNEQNKPFLEEKPYENNGNGVRAFEPLPELPKISQGDFTDLNKTIFEVMSKQNQIIAYLEAVGRRLDGK